MKMAQRGLVIKQIPWTIKQKLTQLISNTKHVRIFNKTEVGMRLP
jgi:hypothetical protein